VISDDVAQARRAWQALLIAMVQPAFALPMACLWLAYATGCVVWWLWLPLLRG